MNGSSGRSKPSSAGRTWKRRIWPKWLTATTPPPNFQALPDAVVAPRNTREVSELLKLCSEEKIPVVPRGSGTNLCAGTTPLGGGIVLLFRHMNRILEIDEENLTVTVQPGVITLDLIRAVEEKGLFYPPDPSSMKISTIGGNISENSGGLRGLKYGVTRDYVLGLEIVMPNGEIIRTGEAGQRCRRLRSDPAVRRLGRDARRCHRSDS
ncbi:FAD-binding protein [Paenibacillus sp. P26]|nr:FAD-binding protein [Paenibacillus sp. P26]